MAGNDFHSQHKVLRDAVDQADMINGRVSFADVRMCAGEGPDYDTGFVDSIQGTTAVVRWDSGVVTDCATEDISVLEEE